MRAAVVAVLVSCCCCAAAQESEELPKLSVDGVYQRLRTMGYTVPQPPPNSITATIGHSGLATVTAIPILDGHRTSTGQTAVRALQLSRAYQARKKVPEELLNAWAAGGRRFMTAVSFRSRIDGTFTVKTQIELQNGTTNMRLAADLGHFWSLLGSLDQFALQLQAVPVDTAPSIRKPALDYGSTVFFLDREELEYLVDQWRWTYKGPRGGSGNRPDTRVLATIEGSFVEVQPWTELPGQPDQPVFALDTFLKRPTKDIDAHLSDLRSRYTGLQFGVSPHGIVAREIVNVRDGLKLRDIRARLLAFARKSKNLPGYMPPP